MTQLLIAVDEMCFGTDVVDALDYTNDRYVVDALGDSHICRPEVWMSRCQTYEKVEEQRLVLGKDLRDYTAQIIVYHISLKNKCDQQRNYELFVRTSLPRLLLTMFLEFAAHFCMKNLCKEYSLASNMQAQIISKASLTSKVAA